MDVENLLVVLFLVSFLFILTLPLSITACIAAAATRKWSMTKARRAQNNAEDAREADRLVEESESEIEEDFLDSEDEQYYQDKRDQKRREREEKEADWQLSARRKFFKEWKKCWRGPSAGSQEQLAKERELKEQDERRQIAREAVREYLRIERKKVRKAASGAKQEQEASMELPTYGNAVADGKH